MFKEKLNKNLLKALTDMAIEEPTLIQKMALSKINSGSDVYINSDEHTGKTTLLLLSSIQKLNYAFEDAPRALIITASEEKALNCTEQFKKLAHYTDLRVTCVTDSGKIEQQTDAIYFGTDVVIGTTKRLVEIYLKRTFNITKLKFFAIDDVEEVGKQNLMSQLERLSLSLPKCQRLFCSNEQSEKADKIISKFSERYIEILV
ncbi:MAG: DEAD/DEAH box helicase [Bacteroidia bacterium]|nr:DEAD/DEAH box helicase [Bacteroidia bacterium]